MNKYVISLFLVLAIGSSIARAANGNGGNAATDHVASSAAMLVCVICQQPNNLIALHGKAVTDEGANIFHETCIGKWTLAVANGKLAIEQALIEANTKVNAVDRDGLTAAQYYAANCKFYRKAAVAAIIAVTAVVMAYFIR